jgi:hypothetical protein
MAAGPAVAGGLRMFLLVTERLAGWDWIHFSYYLVILEACQIRIFLYGGVGTWFDIG